MKELIWQDYKIHKPKEAGYYITNCLWEGDKEHTLEAYHYSGEDDWRWDFIPVLNWAGPFETLELAEEWGNIYPYQEVIWQSYYSIKPNLPGYYAVNHCYNLREGSFLEVVYFNGDEWVDWLNTYSFLDWAGPFQNKEEAENWMYVNDITF